MLLLLLLVLLPLGALVPPPLVPQLAVILRRRDPGGGISPPPLLLLLLLMLLVRHRRWQRVLIARRARVGLELQHLPEGDRVGLVRPPCEPIRPAVGHELRVHLRSGGKGGSCAGRTSGRSRAGPNLVEGVVLLQLVPLL